MEIPYLALVYFFRMLFIIERNAMEQVSNPPRNKYSPPVFGVGWEDALPSVVEG
jgi:hypothetical protein